MDISAPSLDYEGHSGLEKLQVVVMAMGTLSKLFDHWPNSLSPTDNF